MKVFHVFSASKLPLIKADKLVARSLICVIMCHPLVFYATSWGLSDKSVSIMCHERIPLRGVNTNDLMGC